MQKMRITVSMLISLLFISIVKAYSYRAVDGNVVATKDAEKDILAAICGSTAGLSASAREILLQVAT